MNTVTKFSASEESSKPLDKLKIKPGAKWWELVQDEPLKDGAAQTDIRRCPRDKELELRREAEEHLEQDRKQYQAQRGNSRKNRNTDFGWIRVVLSKGALNDKLAAHTLLIQDSAFHNLHSLNALVQMVQSKGKREQLAAMDHLRAIFVDDLLHPKRKLRPFAESVVHVDEISDPKKRTTKLLLAYFEDQVRHHYSSYVDGVEKITHEVVPSTKSKAINVMGDLLANNPEQEKFLLEKLVNKLGDPSGKVASHVSHVLKNLVTDLHPAMKPIVVAEVERLMYRLNVTEKTQYYCLCFLQELVFRRGTDAELANKLVNLYFSFFKGQTKKGDVDNKMMAALLTALSRALPYATLGQSVLEGHMETFYKLVHFVNTNIAIQGLVLMYKVLQGNSSGTLADRYHSVLFRVLTQPELELCPKLAMFLNLVYRVVKADQNRNRTLAFMRRLLQVAMTGTPHLGASIMIVISELIKNKPEVAAKFYGEPFVGDNDQADEEVVANKPTKKAVKSDGKNEDKKETKVRQPIEKENYECNARDPRYARAEKSSPWEIVTLAKHFHPSVSLFASNVAEKKYTQYDGDPLNDFTLKHFLNRFVFRNPKNVEREDSAHARQSTVFGRLRVDKREARSDLLANEKNLVNVNESSIPLEERFIYRYLKDKKTVTVQQEEDVDLESVASDEFEDLLDKYENDFDEDVDMATDFKKGKRKREAADDQDDDEEGGSSDEEFMGAGDMGSDDELDFEGDDDYQAAFGNFKGGFDSDEDDDGGGLGMNEEIPTKHIRRGRRDTTASLFASADKFAEILDANEDMEDVGGSGSEGDEADDKRKKFTISKSGRGGYARKGFGRKKGGNKRAKSK